MGRINSHQSPSVLDVRDPYSAFYQGPHHGKHWYLWHPDDIGTAKPMNEVEWFKAFQPLLLRVINTGYGRQLMGIDSELPFIDLITKNAIRYPLGNGQWQSQFHVGAKWANVIRYRWPEFKRYARFFYDMPNFFTLLNIDGRAVPAHATTTVYPDPHVESTSVGGWGGRIGGFWYSNRADPDADYLSDTTDYFYPQWQFGSDTNGIHRGWTLFDTSSISTGDTVSAAVISVTGNLVNDAWDSNEEYHYVTITGGSPASNTAIVAADYSAMTALNSPTEFVTRNINPRNFNDDDTAYNNVFTLNANGRSAVDKDGISKFLWRDSHDVDFLNQADQPTTLDNHCKARSEDYTGTSKDPKLVVTHSSSEVEKINGLALADIEKFNGITSVNAEKINTVTF